MNYAQIRKMDVSNGEGIGISLFVSGCNFHCKNCFNSEAWDFNYGQKWTKDVSEKFYKLLENKSVSRVSILGGEPLCNENVEFVVEIVENIKMMYPHLKIWLYTGYTAEFVEYHNGVGFHFNPKGYNDGDREYLACLVDVIVDGQYIDDLRDINLAYRGSSNQRLIDVKESLKARKIVQLDCK